MSLDIFQDFFKDFKGSKLEVDEVQVLRPGADLAKHLVSEICGSFEPQSGVDLIQDCRKRKVVVSLNLNISSRLQEMSNI